MFLTLGLYPDTKGLSRSEVSRLVEYRTGHGRFALYFSQFNIATEDPECPCGAVIEPEHLVQCPRRRKVVNEARETYKIGSEEEARQFFLGTAEQAKWLVGGVKGCDQQTRRTLSSSRIKPVRLSRSIGFRPMRSAA